MDLIEDGNIAMLEKVLKTPGASTRQDADGFSPINFAIKKGKTMCLQVFLKSEDIDAKDVDGTGMTPAQTAIEYNQEECFRELITTKVKMPEVEAQITSDRKVVLGGKRKGELKMGNIDLPGLKQMLVDCEITQTDIKEGIPSLVEAVQDADWLRVNDLLDVGVKMVRDPMGRLPISWHLDGHETNPTGKSVIVELVQTGQF